jgi:hypothetical protein
MKRAVLCLVFAAIAVEGAQVDVHGTEHDFDFLIGSWTVHSRRLLKPLTGSKEWVEFGGTNVSRPLWGGRANVDEFHAETPSGPIAGITLRMFDRTTKQWRIYWASAQRAVVDVPPMVGGFENGRGEFYDREEYDGKPIMVRFFWIVNSRDSCRWEQAFSADDGKTWETNWTWDLVRVSEPASRDAFTVIELRRYTLADGVRTRFAEYFDSFFPEAMQQLGAIAAGDFLDRNNPAMFTWIRGFHSMDERARVNAAFYYGPVWKEHRTTANSMMIDSDNVLLLRPVSERHPLLVLPSVDPIHEPDGAHGVIVSLLFAVKPDRLDPFIAEAEHSIATRPPDVREAGLFVTLDEKNNFPQLPVRTDGPFVCWLAVVKDDASLARVERWTTEVIQRLKPTGALRADPELMVLDPSKRSRLRWLP